MPVCCLNSLNKPCFDALDRVVQQAPLDLTSGPKAKGWTPHLQRYERFQYLPAHKAKILLSRDVRPMDEGGLIIGHSLDRSTLATGKEGGGAKPICEAEPETEYAIRGVKSVNSKRCYRCIERVRSLSSHERRWAIRVVAFSVNSGWRGTEQPDARDVSSAWPSTSKTWMGLVMGSRTRSRRHRTDELGSGSRRFPHRPFRSQCSRRIPIADAHCRRRATSFGLACPCAAKPRRGTAPALGKRRIFSERVRALGRCGPAERARLDWSLAGA